MFFGEFLGGFLGNFSGAPCLATRSNRHPKMPKSPRANRQACGFVASCAPNLQERAFYHKLAILSLSGLAQRPQPNQSLSIRRENYVESPGKILFHTKAKQHRMTQLRTRFAPSPTGVLHLGHVLSAIHVWGVARSAAASIALRIEDHDRSRCRPAFEEAIHRDLSWLGFKADFGPRGHQDRPSPWRQSDHPERYRAALDLLHRQGLVYGCSCSRKEIAGEQQAGGVLHYTGHCRTRGLGLGPGVGIRLNLEAAGWTGSSVHFDDLFCGPVTQDPCAGGDFLLRDRHGHWTYQFCVVVDDLHDECTLVIRGQDLLESTARQIQLGKLLGRSSPAVFAHHGLLTDPSGHKLSKRTLATGIEHWRSQGVTPAQLLAKVATLAGLIQNPAPDGTSELQVEQLGGLFAGLVIDT